MKCSRCSYDNRPGAKFCEECAAPLERVCASCGALVSATAKFCPECGRPVGNAGAATGQRDVPTRYTPRHLAAKILTSKAALEGERKQVTVLFADLKGSMELLADRDPEEARKILDPILERMMEAVHHYEGTVNQVMGDGIMALFGAPLAHEDHAVRACYAALRMQESVKQYAQVVRRAEAVSVQIRVGLNSGDVVVRAIGSDLHMDYTAVGQTTHLAARMEQLADPGCILFSADTLRLVEGYVQVKPLGPVPVKGSPEPVEIFELSGAGMARTRLQAAALRGLTRFVGRDAEVEHLRRVLSQADAGHGQVVSVVGEAGVGKSRLTYEFTHSHRVQGWLIVEASSVSYGKATSYLPVIDLLKGYFKIGERDDRREMHAKVLGRVLALDRALEPLLPPLLSLLDVPVEDSAWQNLDPLQRRQRTLDAVKRLLLREAQVQPLLLVFEDLHWIDGESQALLDNLVESLGSARLLLLVNYRPEYEHHWASKTTYSQLRLDSLPIESTQELLAALLGPDPGLASLTQMLVKRGNPFFLEETVRTLVETGALLGERGAYKLTRPLESLQVPASVQTVLAARIDRLPPDEKQLLQAASVIGKDVSYALLAAISEQPEESLLRGLAHLQEAEFLYEARLFPDMEYTFKHALTHEVTYSSLLSDRRRQLHAKIVTAIEQLYADRLFEYIDRLTQHAFRGEAWEKTVEFSQRAGEKALSRSANREAITVYEQALEALGRLPQTSENLKRAVDLRIFLQAPLTQLDKPDRMLDNSRKALSLVEKIDDPLRRGRVLAFMCEALRFSSKVQEALEYGTQAVAIAQLVGRTQLTVTSKLILGIVQIDSGDVSAALELLTASAEAASRYIVSDQSERDGHPVPASRIYARYAYVWAQSYIAYCLAELGTFAEAQARGNEALRVAELLNMSYPLAGANHLLGLAISRKGDSAGAIPLLERAHKIWGAAEIPVFHSAIAAALGGAYILAGRMDEAIAFLKSPVEEGGVMLWEPLTCAYLAQACRLAGRIDEARAAGRRAVALAQHQQYRGQEAWAHQALGEVHASHEAAMFDEARGEFQQSMNLARKLGMRPLVAHCHLGFGKVAAKTGQSEEARDQFTIAMTMYQDMNMWFWLEQAKLEMTALA